MISLFLLISSSLCAKPTTHKKSVSSDNILYVTEANYTETFESLPAVFLFVQQGGEKDDRFRQRVEFLAAAPALGTRCYFAIMDGDRNPRFIRSVGLKYTRGYYFYRYGKKILFYSGPFATSDFVNFAMSRTGCPFTTFDDYTNAQDFIESNEYGVVLYIPSAGGPIFEKYNKFSSILRDNFTFGLCPDEDLAEELGIDKVPSLVLYRLKDRARVFYPDSFENATIVDISAWLSYQLKPRYELFSVEDQKAYQKGPPVIVFFTPVEEQARDATLSLVTKLAMKYDNDIRFTQIDAVTGSRFMTDLGFSRYADPAAAILVYSKGPMKKYRYSEEADFNIDTLSVFIESFLDGRLKAEAKCGHLPENNSGSVVEVNHATFETSVFNSSKNVLMLYYEPWDILYKEFESVYKAIADELANETISRIDFRKIDVSSNDLPSGPDPKTTPAMYLFLQNQKNKPVLYKGGLRKQELLDFLDSEVGIKFDL